MEKRKDVAFVFPGQGAQYIGMAMDYVEKYPEVKQILLDFDKVHNTHLYEIMKDGPEETLKETRFTQPAILFHSVAAWEGFSHQLDFEPAFVAGHSLGEFTSLVASGVLSLQDAMHIVHKRGEFMIKANAGVPFAMSAIIGLEANVVIDICKEAEKNGLVQAVNFNTPIQTVISGTQAGVEAAGELATAKGAKRVIPLVVGGPFHTPLIAQASGWLKDEMLKCDFKPASIPVVSNVDALPEIDPAAIRDKLVKQIISPVRWVACIEYMLSQGVTRFVEFGPQKVLSGMIKNIDKAVVVLNIDKIEDISTVVEEIKNVG
jgi:[acyl-carrier-protein] S-malonyltransferase